MVDNNKVIAEKSACCSWWQGKCDECNTLYDTFAFEFKGYFRS